jgi:hypothetical protein
LVDRHGGYALLSAKSLSSTIAHSQTGVPNHETDLMLHLHGGDRNSYGEEFQPLDFNVTEIGKEEIVMEPTPLLLAAE